MAILELKNTNMKLGEGSGLFCILGMNVLEDEGLALEIAQELKQITHKLNLNFVFKASFDKANRSSITSYRGPGLEKGLKILEKVKGQLQVPVLTDIHEPLQAEMASQVADILQIPAFLCRQTDLLRSALKALSQTGGLLHVKKAQFLAPWDCENIVSKVKALSNKDNMLILCERGSSFGYNNLVVDMLGIQQMQKLGVPVTLDATHAVQLPGMGKDKQGRRVNTGGRREGVATLACAGVAAGVDGIFLEFHTDPEKAKCDGPSCLSLKEASPLLFRLKEIYNLVSK